MRNENGFTLIELLVVVTIIVVLLALLVPAMDKTLHQANLTVCAAQQKAIASSSLLYASSNRRQYPVNTVRRSGGYKPAILGIQNDPDADLRPVIRDYIPITIWVDPLCEPVDLSGEANGPMTTAEASYNYWAGWSYTGAHAVSAMHKLGDKLGWVDNEAANPQPRRHEDRTALLVSDRNDVHANNQFKESSHPDDRGVLRPVDVKDSPSLAGFVTVSWWYDDQQGIPRGPVDLNFAYDDGSVIRHVAVTGDWNNNDFQSASGTRFHGAPWHSGSDVAAKRFVPIH